MTKNQLIRALLVAVLLTAIILLVSCKKKDNSPIIVSDPCETGVVNYSGKYNKNSDSITIEFVSNRCPEVNSNNYQSRDLGKLLQKYATGTYTFSQSTYTFYSTDKTENTLGTGIITNDFTITRTTPKAIVITATGISGNITLFKQ